MEHEWVEVYNEYIYRCKWCDLQRRPLLATRLEDRGAYQFGTKESGWVGRDPGCKPPPIVQLADAYRSRKHG